MTLDCMISSDNIQIVTVYTHEHLKNKDNMEKLTEM